MEMCDPSSRARSTRVRQVPDFSYASHQSASLVDHRPAHAGRDSEFSRSELTRHRQAHALGRARAHRSAVRARPHLLSGGSDFAAHLRLSPRVAGLARGFALFAIAWSAVNMAHGVVSG